MTKRLTHKRFYEFAQRCIAFAQTSPIELRLAAGLTDTLDVELCDAATEHFKRGPRPEKTVEREAEPKPPRKNSKEWVLWMIEGGNALQSHRDTPVSEWKHDLLVRNREAIDYVPVSESLIQSLVNSGQLTSKLVETKPGCWDRIDYTPERKAA